MCTTSEFLKIEFNIHVLKTLADRLFSPPKNELLLFI